MGREGAEIKALEEEGVGRGWSPWGAVSGRALHRALLYNPASVTEGGELQIGSRGWETGCYCPRVAEAGLQALSPPPPRGAGLSALAFPSVKWMQALGFVQ